MSDQAGSGTGPEIVFGLVGSVGTELDFVGQSLAAALRDLNYEPSAIRLSELMHEIDLDLCRSLPEEPAYDRYMSHMTAGNELREFLNRGDALAMLAVGAIREARAGDKNGKPDQPLARHAYILKSLKHPDEVKTLRAIYGPSFHLVAAYSPPREPQAKSGAEISGIRAQPAIRRILPEGRAAHEAGRVRARN